MTPEELKKYRKDRGITIKEMAKKLNTPQKTYENWEYGTRRIPGIVGIIIKKQ